MRAKKINDKVNATADAVHPIRVIIRKRIQSAANPGSSLIRLRGSIDNINIEKVKRNLIS